jgi:hypothetical protein
VLDTHLSEASLLHPALAVGAGAAESGGRFNQQVEAITIRHIFAVPAE